MRLALLAFALTAGLAIEANAQTQDINGDGMVDAVFTQKQRYNQVCFGNGTGAFTTCTDLIGSQFTISNQVNTTDAALVDWDGDGDLDIALAMEGHANVVCFNNGGGQFNSGVGCLELAGYSTFPYNSQEVAAGDLDGDGAQDLVWANGGNAGLPLSQPNVVCLGTNDLVASVCHEFGTDAPSTGVALGDVDSDGDLDVVISNRGALNEVCLNNGRTTNGMNFSCRAIPRATNITATGISHAVALGNLPLNSTPPDQFLDIVFANDGQNERCFGNGNWSGSNVGLDCSGWNNTSAARSLDVVVANINANFVGDEVLFAKEDAMNVFCFWTFTCTTAFNQSTVEASTALAVRDINIDGKLDVVIANVGVTAGASRTYIGQGFSVAPLANGAFQPTSVTLSGGTVGPTIDTTPPAFTGATNVTVEATGANGATAQFLVTATDVVDGVRPVSCAPVSGSLFPVGNTTVTCTSVDTSNNTGTASFLVSVRDTTGPVITVPANISISATPGQATVAVPFNATAQDAVDGARIVTCFNEANSMVLSSGAQFPAGTITVMCGAYDGKQNYAQKSFTVTVTTDVDSDGILDNVDPDDDNDGIVDSVDPQSLVFSSNYFFNASTEGTVTRNGRTVSITPASSGYSLRASVSGAGTGVATIVARCGGGRKELRLDTAGETVDWRCNGTTLEVKFVSGAAEFWKSLGFFGDERIKPSADNTAASSGSPVTADPTNTAPMLVSIFNTALTEIGSFSLDAGESVDVQIVEGPVGTDPVLQLELLNGGADGKVTVLLFNMPVTLQQGNGPATFSMTQTVFASGTAAVTAWDPIFTTFSPWQAQCSAAPAFGLSANWVNPHAAFSFPLGTHSWENIPPMNFSANWINAWEDKYSRNASGRSASGQSWTKYSTQVTGEGDFVVQFLADNCSWIYLDDQLIGVQDDNWWTNNSGRYPVALTGPGPHTLSFIIFDGGGDAGGKFRLETRQSFIDNGGDPDELPTKASTTTTVSFGDGPFVYSGSAFTAVATVSNNGVANIAYGGDCVNAGSTCTATATYDGDSGHLGSSATASITIAPAPTTTTVSFSAPSFVYTGAAIEATASAGASIVYTGSCTNVGTCTATATNPGDANHIGSSAVATADITMAPTTTTVNFSAPSYVYTGAAIEATASAGATIVYSGSCTNVGTCTATATNPGDANHSSSSAVASADITKAATTTTVNFSAASYVYTGSAIEASASAGASIVYSGSCTNVGTCTATATNAGDANHSSSSAVATADITKAPTTTTVNFSAPSYVYTGAAIEASASAGASIVYSGSCTNVGTCTATATNPGDDNHSSSSAVATADITKATSTTTVSFGAGPFVYRGSAFTATASTTPTGTPAVVYTGDCTNAGTTCSATATYAGDANHFGSSNSASITIARATATVVVTPYVVEYDGQPHSAGFAITGVNGQTGAAVGVVTHNTTHTNVGTYADAWSFAGANYVSIGNTPITNVIKDTTAPSVGSVAPSTGSLWPPNHQMVTIGLTITSSDLVGVVKYNVAVTSSEPDNGLGDGDTANDFQISGNGTMNPSVSLRSERSGGGNGRTYTISVVAIDAAGNASAARTTTVSVPKSQGKK